MAALEALFIADRIDAVMHFAALAMWATAWRCRAILRRECERNEGAAWCHGWTGSMLIVLSPSCDHL